METLTNKQIEERIEKAYAEAFQLQTKGKQFTAKIMELVNLPKSQEIIGV